MRALDDAWSSLHLLGCTPVASGPRCLPAHHSALKALGTLDFSNHSVEETHPMLPENFQSYMEMNTPFFWEGVMKYISHQTQVWNWTVALFTIKDSPDVPGYSSSAPPWVAA